MYASASAVVIPDTGTPLIMVPTTNRWKSVSTAAIDEKDTAAVVIKAAAMAVRNFSFLLI